MSFINIKASPLLLSIAFATVSASAVVPRASAVQLDLEDSLESVKESTFAVPYDPTLGESGLVESAAQDAEVAGFTCETVPSESTLPSEQDQLSSLGPNLIASAVVSDNGQQLFTPVKVAQLGPIIGEMCDIFGAPVGGTGGGFPLGLLAIPAAGGLVAALTTGGGDGEPPAVPEPAAVPVALAMLGLGGIVARRKFNRSK